jgi:hypothetical protein
MTLLAALRRKGRRVIRPGNVPTPPSTGGFLSLAMSLGAVGIWPLSESSGTAIADATGTMPGEWVTGTPLFSQPTLITSAEDLYGKSSFLPGSVRGRIPYHVSHVGAGFTAFAALQPRAVAAKAIVLARDQFGAAGGMSLEIEAGGQPRAYLRDAGNVARILTGSVGAFDAGQAAAYAVSGGAAGHKLYLNSATPIATAEAVTDALAGTSEITIGAWHTGGAAPYRGLMGWLLWFPTQLSNANVGALIAELGPSVTWANPDSATVQVGQQVTIDALANDSFQGTQAGATTAIDGQGSLVSYSVLSDRTIRATAGQTAGMDTGGGYRVNGSNRASLTVEVTAAPPPPPPSGTAGTLRGLTPTNSNSIAVLYQRDRGFAQPTASVPLSAANCFWGLRSVQSLLSPASYAFAYWTSHLYAQKLYDHSPSGIISSGNWLGKFAIDQHNRYSTRKPRICWTNFEKFTSINVPTLVDGTTYNTATDDIWATVPTWGFRNALMHEAYRLQNGIIAQAKAYCVAQGYPFMEFGSYNAPRKLNEGDFTATVSHPKNQYEINSTTYQAFINTLDLTGPQVQILTAATTAANLRTSSSLQAQFIEGMVNGCRIRQQAAVATGRTIRIGPCVWPQIWALGGSTDYAFRPGMMTNLLQGCFNAGVRRFVFFQWDQSKDRMTSAEITMAHEAMEEAAAWISARSANIVTVE